jgi:penicillin-binding protein 2
MDENTQPVYRTYDPDDYIGQTGIERQMEELLRGQKGGAYYERDAFGVELRELAGATPAVPGRNLKLTVDLELQAAISRALAEGIDFSTNDRLAKDPEKKANTRGGAVVMMSPKTGEVFALVSYPNYDNQLFIDGLSVLKAREYGLGIDPEEERKRKEAEERGEVYEPAGLTDHMINRAYASHFAPGSTVKIFLALAGLRDGYIDANKTYYCGGAIMVPWTWDESKGQNYFCWIRNASGEHGDVSVVSAIEQSCDIFFYNLGTPKQRPEGDDDDLHYYDGTIGNPGQKHYFEGMGIERMKKNLVKRFWFGEPTRIQLPFEAVGLVPDQDWKFEAKDDYWSSGDTINTSIGQGDFLASPLQIAVNTASIANDGILYRPRIVHAIVDNDGNEVQVFKPEKLRRLNWEQEHIDLVREGMRRVVHGDNGSARFSTVDGQQVTKWPLTNPGGDAEEIIIGGKTGTAEVGAVNPDGTYNEQHAWFTCYAPFDDPEVVLTVFLERGGEGASYAVPIADKALRAYFELTGRRPRGTMLREDKQPISDLVPPPGEQSDPLISEVPEE